jgi:hypothetical protein
VVHGAHLFVLSIDMQAGLELVVGVVAVAENIILSEFNQTLKAKTCIFFHLCGL